MPLKKTFSEVALTFKERGYELLETEYIGHLQKMKFKCPKHPEQNTEITYKQLRRGEGCKYCGRDKTSKAISTNRRKWSLSDVQKEFQKNGCILLENKYETSNDSIKYKCKCGKISKTTFKQYIKGSGVCKRCANKKERIWTHESVKKYFEEQGCELISVYIEQNQKLKYKCNCGKLSQVKLANFLNGNRCKECSAKKRRLDYSYVKSFFESQNCKLLSKEYKSSTFQKLDYICSCGNEHSIRFLSFRRGERCPMCSSISKGEKAIKMFLEENNIEFEYQYVLKECKNINPLPFDFAIKRNGEINFLLEFDGKQHFLPVEKFGGEEYLETVIRHDNIKEEYCRKNSILLRRINYKQIKDINKILSELLFK